MADVSFITARLATGGGIQSSSDVTDILQLGISAIIDCRAEFDDTVEFAKTGVVVLWNGVPDDGDPVTHGPEWFGKSLAFALPLLAQPHHRVLCHCAAGVNRGPSTAFAIMLGLGFTAEDAEAIIRKARPQVGLAYKSDATAAVPQLGY